MHKSVSGLSDGPLFSVIFGRDRALLQLVAVNTVPSVVEDAVLMGKTRGELSLLEARRGDGSSGNAAVNY